MMQPSKQIIGVFDSGIGGLSVLKHIHARLPNEPLVYLADSAFMPYGCKPPSIIEDRCLHIADFFTKHHCKAIVLACNTATAVSIHHLRKKYSYPIIGMEPAIKPAVIRSQTGVIGVLVTNGTANSEKFNQLKQRFGTHINMIVQPCPGLVESIEAGNTVNNTVVYEMLKGFLQPLLQQGIDTLVLGCTHYPFVIPLIRDIIGEHITIIDSGHAISCELERQLNLHHLRTPSKTIEPIQFWTSGDIQCVGSVISKLWQHPVSLRKMA
ncbi:MAG: glutamate racemase [Mariprofundaceae bacterium]|nr:glutamate racemase [Mariprofundaceae bacterium]